jgi:hypothetical protein
VVCPPGGVDCGVNLFDGDAAPTRVFVDGGEQARSRSLASSSGASAIFTVMSTS